MPELCSQTDLGSNLPLCPACLNLGSSLSLNFDFLVYKASTCFKGMVELKGLNKGTHKALSTVLRPQPRETVLPCWMRGSEGSLHPAPPANDRAEQAGKETPPTAASREGSLGANPMHLTEGSHAVLISLEVSPGRWAVSFKFAGFPEYLGAEEPRKLPCKATLPAPVPFCTSLASLAGPAP